VESIQVKADGPTRGKVRFEGPKFGRGLWESVGPVRKKERQKEARGEKKENGEKGWGRRGGA